MLKKIMMGTAIAALLASTAMAQSYQPEWGSGNIVPNTNQSPGGSVRSEINQSFAYQKPDPRHTPRHPHAHSHAHNHGSGNSM